MWFNMIEVQEFLKISKFFSTVAEIHVSQTTPSIALGSFSQVCEMQVSTATNTAYHKPVLNFSFKHM